MRGFTLIELLVVFVIIATVLAVAVPMLGPISPGTRLESDVRAFTAFLREARSDAIVGNREVVVTLATNRGTYAVAEPPRQGRFASKVELAMTAAKVEQVDEATGGFRFFPDGSSTGGEVRIAAGPTHFVVKVEWLTGRIAVAP